MPALQLKLLGLNAGAAGLLASVSGALDKTYQLQFLISFCCFCIGAIAAIYGVVCLYVRDADLFGTGPAPEAPAVARDKMEDRE